MTDSLNCSVIIPTYNRAELLRCTLDSLVRQTLPVDRFEVLVVDDGSSDGTADVVEEYQGVLNLRYFFQEDEGWRLAKARNVGIVNARAGMCVFLDSGVVAHSGCLAAHVDSYVSTPERVAVIGYVYGFGVDDGDAQQINETIDAAAPDATIESMRESGQWPDIRDLFYHKYTDDFHDRVPAPWLTYWGCNVSADTAQLRAIGMFDEAFRSWGAEDTDLAYRLFLDGARFVLNRQAAAIHVPHDKSFANNMRDAAANTRYMVAKYGTPVMQLLTEVPVIPFFEMNNVIVERGLPNCADYLSRKVV
jgi:glycosyltransferase involved in cell wall biosynthesis